MRFTVIPVQKNYKCIWTAVDREAGEFVYFVIGNRGTETGTELWNKVKDYAQGIVGSHTTKWFQQNN